MRPDIGLNPICAAARGSRGADKHLPAINPGRLRQEGAVQPHRQGTHTGTLLQVGLSHLRLTCGRGRKEGLRAGGAQRRSPFPSNTPSQLQAETPPSTRNPFTYPSSEIPSALASAALRPRDWPLDLPASHTRPYVLPDGPVPVRES